MYFSCDGYCRFKSFHIFATWRFIEIFWFNFFSSYGWLFASKKQCKYPWRCSVLFTLVLIYIMFALSELWMVYSFCCFYSSQRRVLGEEKFCASHWGHSFICPVIRFCFVCHECCWMKGGVYARLGPYNRVGRYLNIGYEHIYGWRL